MESELQTFHLKNQMTIWKEEAKSQIRMNEDLMKKLNSAFIKDMQELKSYNVLVDQGGFYYLRITTPNNFNKNSPSTPIFAVPISATIYFTANKKETILMIHFSDHRIKLPLTDIKTAIRSFIPTIESSGLTISLSSRLKKEIAPQLLQQVILHAEFIELPISSGWNKMSSAEWRFVSREDMKMEDIINDY